jgi:hypothetical protein
VILDGHEVEDCLSHLVEIEAAFPHLTGPREGESVLRLAGRWLVEEGHLRDRLLSGLVRGARGRTRTPSIGDLKTAPLVRAAFSGARIRSRSRAVAICFKQSIRSFYVEPRPVTLKMANPTSLGRDLRKEIETRRRLVDTEGVIVPRLIASNVQGPPPYLWEELVFGRHLDSRRDHAFFLGRVLPRILDFYAGGGVRAARVSEFLDLQRLVADVLQLAERARWSNRWIDRPTFRTRVMRCSKMASRSVLVGAGHGDLSNGNILITPDDRVCLIDWSRSREVILMQDLEKLFQEYPGSWGAAVDRLESLRPAAADPGGLLPWSEQALLGNLQLIQFFGASRERLAKRRDALAKRYVRQFDRILAKEFATAAQLMQSGEL